MNRLQKYIDTFFYRKIEKQGFCYISDEDLFVLEDLANILRYDQILRYTNANERKKNLEDLFQTIQNDKDSNPKSYIKTDLLALIGYQLFLDDAGYDGRNKKRVRELITEEFLNLYENVKMTRGKYFYDSKKVDINFVDDISSFISLLQKETNKNSDYFYRGHSNLEWELVPSIYREKWIKNEDKMFREIILSNSEEFSSTKSAFEKLTIMQHYGLPTRLLDITKNPLVALFFACNDETQMDHPGELIIFKPKPNLVKYYDSDTVSILSNLSKAERDLKIIKNKIEFNSHISGLKLLHLIKEEKNYFLPEILPSDLEKTLIVKPINNNERIKRQLGYFFLFGINNSINKPANINSVYERNGIVPKFLIEKKNKEKIINELEVLGISTNTMFPEIDKGTEYLKNKYKNFA